ncbi:23S rRNA (uracil(1939)-C(5))-methyltransferase RlmD [Paenibacillus sp. WLX1005]|uniref:23S rRNA (uracil(1939)-C(5))-methyltransferase RlmD n=1 Tax=Paenibacillus sp. WLX1005 TaxID=3243766 RepID=UPI003983E3E4
MNNNNRRGGKKHNAPRRQSAATTAAIANLPVSKNDELELDIIGLTHEGEGVGRTDGYTLFVSGALPGEKVQARVVKTKKQYGYAKMLTLLQGSPDRVNAPCPIFSQCGGCQIQHMNYHAQLEWKRQHVIDNLERIGKLKVLADSSSMEQTDMDGNSDEADKATGTINEIALTQDMDNVHGNDNVAGANENTTSTDPRQQATSTSGIRVLPTLGMAEPWRYRNKAQVPMGEQDGRLIGGFYARGSHRIIDMQSCLIQDSRNDQLVNKVKQIGSDLRIPTYNEETGEGILRHVVVKVGFSTNEMMVVLVTNGERLPRKPEWIERIRAEMPQVVSICQNINMKQTNVIFGDETIVLWGNEVIHDYIGDVKFAISARSFYQVNPVQTEVLYEKAVQYAGLTGKETVIDAYCGIGTISLFLAQHAERVYGVEIVKEAIEDARKNAELNGMSNVEFEVGASEDVIPRWKEQGITPDVIVVDPPRKGCDPRLLETILQMQPEKVVYVSCNPSTLARDLQVLEAGGYRTVEVQPVDMFPHTVHVESVAVLVWQGLN